MPEFDAPHLHCPSCGQNLRGLAPMPPALLLRCPECGSVTTIRRIAEREVRHRRSLRHLLLWVTILLLVLTALLFRRAVMGIVS